MRRTGALLPSCGHRPARIAAVALATAFLLAFLAVAATVPGAAAASEAAPSPLAGVSLETLGYFDYSAGVTPREEGGDQDYNRFTLTRGYLTLKKKSSDWLSMRVTMDVHQDDAGSYEARAKYYYVELRPRALGPLSGMRSELGMGHMPWLDFEEHVNPYRCQGTMAIERAGIFNSSDLGVSLRGSLGGELPDAAARTGNAGYAGRWGSWHLGVYNGGGYHAVEQNQNKALEGRVTLRPLPRTLPGLQASWLGIHGKGNTERPEGGYPDYQVQLAMLSWQLPQLIVTAQAFWTDGNAKGSYVVPEGLPHAGRALKTLGTSVFATWRLPVPQRRWSLLGRWDRFDVDRRDLVADRTAYDLVLGGAAYEIAPGNLLLVAFESTIYQGQAPLRGQVPEAAAPGRPVLDDEWKVQAVYQIGF